MMRERRLGSVAPSADVRMSDRTNTILLWTCRYVLNQPNQSVDPSGHRVELRSRIIRRNGADIPGAHCFLFVKCGTNDDQTDSDGHLIGYLFPTYECDDYLNNAEARGNGDAQASRAGLVSRSAVFGPANVERCLVDKGKMWANQYIIGYRGVRGPNSNTYVHWLLTQCGAFTSPPALVPGWGVPGWTPGLTPFVNQRGTASDF